ncbi:hypothetical protein HYFRA_00013346 [Hymenoscyphus fraxineus]|uniref:3-beta hydroxysteroid dehydrogenase/isomerase domain-containing protein n=1 Tax=Hymenoscyphus fraxineus TaxID=746836 RepID=A0A9N9LB85_9HELO|nr:hypothetical protein HYFRA_00013346 [Hymenoscyphus fraxineus]
MAANTILVTGGCGCVGYHIVKALLEESSSSEIHVFSRNPTQNRLPKVKYHAGSLTNPEDLKSIFSSIQPTVVFHVASPTSAGNTASAKLFYDVNVEGTKALLTCAQECERTKAFIYTSSSTVAKSPNHFTTEAQPLLPTTSKTDFDYYATTKAIADQFVLNSNEPNGLKTCCLRLALIYGERDNQMIPGVIKVLHDNQHTNQIGNNTALMDFLSARNAARAHVLAYKALMKPETASQSKVAGEAFFITDGKPVPFWDISRKIWAAAGDKTPPEKIKVVPVWLVLGLAVALEWIYWVFTFGQKSPGSLRSHTIRWVTEERTYSIEKARERLGYEPVDETDQSIKEGVEWHLKELKEKWGR